MTKQPKSESPRGRLISRPTDVVEVRFVAGKGRGVFARREIRRGEVIERTPVIVIPKSQCDNLNGTILERYWFAKGKDKAAIALGYGSLYNHSYRPNAEYADKGTTKVFTAIRDIAAGEELTVNYNGDPHNKSPVWFEVAE